MSTAVQTSPNRVGQVPLRKTIKPTRPGHQTSCVLQPVALLFDDPQRPITAMHPHTYHPMGVSWVRHSTHAHTYPFTLVHLLPGPSVPCHAGAEDRLGTLQPAVPHCHPIRYGCVRAPGLGLGPRLGLGPENAAAPAAAAAAAPRATEIGPILLVN